jgi:hypothetical protein
MGKSRKERKPAGNRANQVKNTKQIQFNSELIAKLKKESALKES